MSKPLIVSRKQSGSKIKLVYKNQSIQPTESRNKKIEFYTDKYGQLCIRLVFKNKEV